MFAKLQDNVSFPQVEEEILSFWKERAIYEKSLEQRKEGARFVFYEGPPTANGLPHPGHCLTRAIKDLFPRYRTMRGQYCERKAGWDTHGLPVEVEVCKELGIHSKEEIEEFGVEPFIQKCQQSVWRYMQQWERLTERLGFWIHLDEAYVTYHQSYVESVWWSLKRFFDEGLLYQGHKIVWWWAQGGTALSAGEVGQGYRQVADPSVFVRFPLLDEPNTSLLVWTTTPWTLPSNQFAAVNPKLEYATVEDEFGERFVVAAELMEALAEKAKATWTEVARRSGTELLGLRYRPPFDFYYQQFADAKGKLKDGGEDYLGWRIVAADFVTTDSGTGLVHQAPAFGEVDYDVLISDQLRFVDDQGPVLICAVGPDGKFTQDAPPFAGMWVKDADKPITRDLKERKVLWLQDQYLHEYPFCWRAENDPLIQYPRRSWFVRTSQFKQQMLDNNHQINWLPDHIRDGRFGNFLESNVDWALSRERYWGTPLPIWVCQSTGKMEAMASYRELMDKPGVAGTDAWEKAKASNPDLPEDLKVHKPYIDEVTYDSPFDSGARMQRVSEVIDCWYDSGAMPFAQWGYPHRGADEFKQQFPADFISEALDQTRGWFYSLLAISTLLFGESTETDFESADETGTLPWPHPYRTCIVLGLMLGEDGQKMSKQKRNYREPSEIFDKYGADALRWFFFASQPPWTTIQYREQAIKDSIPEFLLRLWNVYSFFVIYANIDGFDPSQRIAGSAGQAKATDLESGDGYRPIQQRDEVDRWIISEMHRTSRGVVDCMDNYDNYGACQLISQFVDALSNWYVRRNRDRFWTGDLQSAEKLDAYWTLYEVLLTTSKLIAPFTPFLAESLWQNLGGVFGERAIESVHLCDYPTADESLVDDLLSERMEMLREIASLGRSARMNAKLKVRQPLALVEVILADTKHQEWLEAHDQLLEEELNVKALQFTTDAEQYISYMVMPNFKRLGPRVGKLMPAVKKELAAADGGELLQSLNAAGEVTLSIGQESVTLTSEDIEVRLEAKEGWAAAQGSHCVVVLATELTPQLLREGLARDLVRFVQDQRKTLNCQYTDRIEIALDADDEAWQAIQENLDYISGETLATKLTRGPLDGVEPVVVQLGGGEVKLFVRIP